MQVVGLEVEGIWDWMNFIAFLLCSIRFNPRQSVSTIKIFQPKAANKRFYLCSSAFIRVQFNRFPAEAAKKLVRVCLCGACKGEA